MSDVDGDKNQTSVISIKSVKTDPKNTRVRDQVAKDNLERSLRQFGPGRSIVLDGDNIVRAGNGTLEAAEDAGFSEVLVVEPKPNQIVAVRRSDWSGVKAAAYGVQDNRATDLSRNDPTTLAEVLEMVRNSEDADVAIEDTGFTSAQVDELLEKAGSEGDEIPLDEASSPKAGDYLSWSDEKIPLTEAESQALTAKLKTHVLANATIYGFVASLLEK